MSDTHPNAFRLELADKEKQLASLKGEIESLKKKVSAAEAEDQSDEPQSPVTPETNSQPDDSPKTVTRGDDLDVQEFGDEKSDVKSTKTEKVDEK